MTDINKSIDTIINRYNILQKFILVAIPNGSDFKPEDTLKIGDSLGIDAFVLTTDQANNFASWYMLNRTKCVVYIPGTFSTQISMFLLKQFALNKKEIIIIYNGSECEDSLTSKISYNSIWLYQ